MSTTENYNQNTVQETAYRKLDEDFARPGGLTHHTYEATGGGKMQVVTANSFLDQKQHVSRTVNTLEDGSYEIIIHNSDLEKEMAREQFDDLRALASWDVSNPYTEFIQPQDSFSIEQPDSDRFEELDEGIKMRMLRQAQKVTGGQAVSMSVMMKQLVGTYADGHDPYKETTPDRDDEVTFTVSSTSDARHMVHIGLSVSVYDSADVEVWDDDQVRVTFTY